MKKFLALFLLLSPIALKPSVCLAQNQESVSPAINKDVAKFVEEIKAKLPDGWEVEYRAKGSRPKNYPFMGGEATIDFIKVTRLEKTKMWPRFHGELSVQQKRTDNTVDENFQILLAIPFLSKTDYDNAIVNNQKLKTQLEEMEIVLRKMGIYSSFNDHAKYRFRSVFFATTPEQKIKAEEYETLRSQIVSIPRFYFQGISIDSEAENGPLFAENSPYNYRRVQDKTVRRECALVTQDVYSLLSSYSGEKFKIDEKELTEE